MLMRLGCWPGITPCETSPTLLASMVGNLRRWCHKASSSLGHFLPDSLLMLLHPWACPCCCWPSHRVCHTHPTQSLGRSIILSGPSTCPLVGKPRLAAIKESAKAILPLLLFHTPAKTHCLSPWVACPTKSLWGPRTTKVTHGCGILLGLGCGRGLVACRRGLALGASGT